MVSQGAIFLLVVNCLLGASATYNMTLSMCGSPSNPVVTSDYECTGALFTAVDINQLNTLKNEQGCVAGMLGLSTQLKGYHCLAFRNCPGASCTCEVRQGCSSSPAAADTSKACLYGVNEASECPADAPSRGSTPALSSAARSRCSLVLVFLLIAWCVSSADASSNTSLSMCGSPSNPVVTTGYACTGSLFTAVDINQLNTLKNEQGCLAGMLGLSTQLTGYHCLAFKNCPGASCTCEVRQGCSSSTASTDTSKACLYGISEASECPTDAPNEGIASGARVRSSIAMISVGLFMAGVAQANLS